LPLLRKPDQTAINAAVSVVRTNAAAGMLDVSPNTLRSWERRFGFPRPSRTQGGHRQYEMAEIEALREAFAETHNVSSAISLARERGEGPSTGARVEAALRRFDEARADRLMEESLALRSVERTVEEVLLAAVERLGADQRDTPEYQFAWRYATGWLSAALRVSPPAHRPEGVMIFDAAGAYDPDALHAQALELALRRGGLRTLAMSTAVDPGRLGRALRALAPTAVVLTGTGAPMDVWGRLVYAARAGERAVWVLDYRGALPDTGASTVGRLGNDALAARDLLLERLRAGGTASAPAAAACPAGANRSAAPAAG
jgi:DNA-binding transcriptional MerR regulator